MLAVTKASDTGGLVSVVLDFLSSKIDAGEIGECGMRRWKRSGHFGRNKRLKKRSAPARFKLSGAQKAGETDREYQ